MVIITPEIMELIDIVINPNTIDFYTLISFSNLQGEWVIDLCIKNDLLLGLSLENKVKEKYSSFKEFLDQNQDNIRLYPLPTLETLRVLPQGKEILEVSQYGFFVYSEKGLEHVIGRKQILIQVHSGDVATKDIKNIFLKELNRTLEN